MPTTIERVCEWCDELSGATLGYPFGPEAAVYKVGGKIFALVAVDESPGRVTVKAPPEEGEALRAQYAFVREGYYMNKRHWITIDLVAEAPLAEIRELIVDSHRLVVAGLPKATRTALRSGLGSGP